MLGNLIAWLNMASWHELGLSFMCDYQNLVIWSGFGIMQLVMVWGLVLVGQNLDFSLTYYAGVVAAALLFGWQQWLARDRSRDQCFRAFLNNNYVGLALFLGIAGEYALA